MNQRIFPTPPPLPVYKFQEIHTDGTLESIETELTRLDSLGWRYVQGILTDGSVWDSGMRRVLCVRK